jgi:hypothetical protein
MNRNEQLKQIAKAGLIGWCIGLALLIPFYGYIIYAMLSCMYC